MGQALARAAASRLSVPKSLSKAIDSYESEIAKDAMRDIAAKRAAAKGSYIDPNAALSGFTRGESPSPNTLHGRREQEQEQFLKARSQESPQEMPQDLINFLNEAGPLKRVVDKSLTSPKVYDVLKQEEDTDLQKLRTDEAKLRTRRQMSLVQDETNDGTVDENNAMSTTRTTNFSTTQISKDINTVQFTDFELCCMFDKHASNMNNTNFALDLLKEQEFNGDEQKKEQYLNLITNAINFTENPTLMIDVDKSVIGARSDKIEHLKFLKLKKATDMDLWLKVEAEQKSSQ